MIVKNEESNLKRIFTQEFLKAFDEIIVVDTGSTDGTLSFLANIKKIKQFKFEWRDDFSEARNFSFSHATSEYIMWLDADDEIPEQELYRIRELGSSDVYLSNYFYSKDSFGRPEYSINTERIVRRSVGIKWIYPVHENMQYDSPVTRVQANFRIIHNKSEKNWKRSLKRNARILSAVKILTPILEYQYGRTLLRLNNETRGVKLIKSAISKTDKAQAPMLAYLANITLAKHFHDAKNYKQSLEFTLGALEVFKENPDALVLYGELLIHSKKFDEASEVFEKILNRYKEFPVAIVEASILSFRFWPHYYLVVISFFLKNDKASALLHINKSLELCPLDESVLSLLQKINCTSKKKFVV